MFRLKSCQFKLKELVSMTDNIVETLISWAFSTNEIRRFANQLHSIFHLANENETDDTEDKLKLFNKIIQ